MQKPKIASRRPLTLAEHPLTLPRRYSTYGPIGVKKVETEISPSRFFQQEFHQVNFPEFATLELGEVLGPARSSAGELATGRGLTFGPGPALRREIGYGSWFDIRPRISAPRFSQLAG